MVNLELSDKHLLCFVQSGFAYFTDNFEGQWGDDWNDAPYEHNAGLPYDRDPSRNNQGNIRRLVVTGLEEACRDHHNSPWSVEDINRGEVPWLTTCRWSDQDRVEIYAGVGMSVFVRLVWKAGGSVYVPLREEDLEDA